MNSRERLLTVLRGEIPDYVPVCPDISNMVPCKLTGKPFWQIYANQDPPLWKAYIDAVKYFDIDGGFELSNFGPVDVFADITVPPWEERVVQRSDNGEFVTRKFFPDTGKWAWDVIVYTCDQPPAYGVSPDKVGLPETPSEWEPMENVRKWPVGMDLWMHIREELGEHGILGLSSGACTCALHTPEDIYSYYDDPRPWRCRRDERLTKIRERMENIAAMPVRPDFLTCGASGSLVFQTVEIFRELCLPELKLATELAADLGIPTHVHSCGPEKELVRIAVEETQLTSIDPLEIPPMGDCNLTELKHRFGERIVLKGNLHTTEVMLKGSVDDVIRASEQAIDDAGKGGGFILSTGDQCGRDTPHENLRAMVETARTYGKY